MNIIYKCKSFTSGKPYVGWTSKTIEHRIANHKRATKNGSQNHFHRAIRKYGIDDFEITIIETDVDSERWAEREIYWIDYFDSYTNGYNMTIGGQGRLGVILTEETKSKISKSLKKVEDNGKTVAENKAERRVKTIEDNGGFEEISKKSSDTQKKNGKNKGIKNPRYKSTPIVIEDSNGTIIDEILRIEYPKSSDDLPPWRMVQLCLQSGKPMYCYNKPRIKNREKFIGWKVYYKNKKDEK